MVRSGTQCPEGPPSFGLSWEPLLAQSPTVCAAGPLRGTVDPGCSWQILRISVSSLEMGDDSPEFYRQPTDSPTSTTAQAFQE